MINLHIHLEANIQKDFLQSVTELELLPDPLNKLASKRSRFVAVTFHHARKYFMSRLANQTACTAPLIAVLDMRAAVLK